MQISTKRLTKISCRKKREIENRIWIRGALINTCINEHTNTVSGRGKEAKPLLYCKPLGGSTWSKQNEKEKKKFWENNEDDDEAKMCWTVTTGEVLATLRIHLAKGNANAQSEMIPKINRWWQQHIVGSLWGWNAWVYTVYTQVCSFDDSILSKVVSLMQRPFIHWICGVFADSIISAKKKTQQQEQQQTQKNI